MLKDRSNKQKSHSYLIYLRGKKKKTNRKKTEDSFPPTSAAALRVREGLWLTAVSHAQPQDHQPTHSASEPEKAPRQAHAQGSTQLLRAVWQVQVQKTTD